MIVENTKVQFRDGVDEFLEFLFKNNIPLSIVSAGVGNVITELFDQKLKMHPNINIAANFLEFNDENSPVNFKGETIHMFNKSKAITIDENYFKLINHRKNIILLGDSEGK